MRVSIQVSPCAYTRVRGCVLQKLLAINTAYSVLIRTRRLHHSVQLKCY